MAAQAANEQGVAGKSSLRVCLAGSGGGHVRQLLDLDRVWAQHDYFFLTEDTALSRSIAEKHPTRFIPHFAMGQARLGAPFRMLKGALKSFFQSAAIIFREKPDVLITSGAGAVVFGVFWARVRGAKVIVVESFARFDHPSMFGRLTSPLAHRRIAQSAALAKYWPEAKVFDPLKVLDAASAPPKKPEMFVTVGTVLPFDRLVEMVAEVAARGEIPEKITIQTGKGGFAPVGIDTVESLTFDEIQARLRDADIVVCHGGTGSLITALRQGCRVIAAPRLFEKGEVYDDHQKEITSAFASRGLLRVANNADELSLALAEVRKQPRVVATSDPAELIDHLNSLLNQWFPEKIKRARR